MKFYYIPNIFDLHIFDNETANLLKNFKICLEMYFVSLFSLNERNFTISFLMIHSKCSVVHYVDLNPSCINKPFLNYGPLNMLFRFFRLLIHLYFKDAFVKNFMKKLSIFNTNFHNSCQDVLYYRILGCQTLWY